MSITIGQMVRRLDAAPEVVRGALHDAAGEVVESAADAARRLALQRLRRRSGRLADSIRAVSGRHNAVRGGGGDVDYFALHEDGGVARPRGRWLAIPVDDSVQPRDPRAHGDLVWTPDARGGALRQRSTGRPMFLLRSSVRMRGQHFMRDAVNAEFPRIVSLLHQRVSAALEGSQ